MANDNNINLLINIKAHENSKNDLKAEIKKIEEQLSKDPIEIKIKIDQNIIKTLNSFIETSRKFSSEIDQVNGKLAKQVKLVQNENGEWEKRTRIFKEDGIHEYYDKITKKQEEALANKTKEIKAVQNEEKAVNKLENAYDELGKKIKTVEHKDADKNTYKKSETYKNLADIETTVHTAAGKETGYTVVTKDKSYQQLQLEEEKRIGEIQTKNYNDAKEHLLQLRKLRQEYHKLNDKDTDQAKELTKQMTYHRDKLTDILRSKIDTNNGDKVACINADKYNRLLKLREQTERNISLIDKKNIDKSIKQNRKDIEAETLTKQKANYDAIAGKITKIGELKTKLEKTDLADINTRKELISQISQEKKLLNDLYNTKINLSNGEKANLLSAEQTVKVKQQLLNLEKGIANTKGLTTAANYDAQAKAVERFKNSSVDSLDKLRARWETIMPHSDLLKQLDLMRAKILAIDSANKKIGTEELKKYKQELNTITNVLNKTGREIEKTQTKGLSFGKQLNIALERVPVWAVATSAIYGSLREIREGIGYLTELDSAMTEIRIVTNMTKEDNLELAQSYNKLAKEMSTTTAEIAKASVEFYRQGLSDEEVTKRLKTAIQYGKISSLEFKESAEILTATVNSMNIDINRAADVFSYLGDATATGADEIGRAFQKVGGSAGALNVEFEKVSAWIAVVSSKTRESAESIGTSFKSILARIQNMKAYGFDEEDGTKVNQVAKALAEVNIALMDSNGQFRNTGVVFDELGAKWDTLDSRQRAYLATTIAGTRQQSRFYALMDGYAESVDLYNEALNASGTSLKKYDIWMESTEAHVEKFTATIEGFWQKAIDTDTIRGIVDAGTSLAEVFTRIVDKVGLLPPVFALVSIAITMISASFRSFILSIVESIAGMLGLTTAMTAEAAAARSATVATIGLSGALRSIPGVALIGVIATIAGLLLELGINAVFANDNVDKLNESINDSVNNYQTLDKEIKESQGLLQKYNELNNKIIKTNEEKEELLSINQKLLSIYPTLSSYIDNEGNSVIVSNKAIEEQINLKKELLEIEKQSMIENFKNQSETNQDELTKQAQEMKNAKQQIIDAHKELSRLEQSYKNSNVNDPTIMAGTLSNIDKQKELIAELETNFDELSKAYFENAQELKQQALVIMNLDDNFNKLDATIKFSLIDSLFQMGELTSKNMEALKKTNIVKYFKDFQSAVNDFGKDDSSENLIKLSESLEIVKKELIDFAKNNKIAKEEEEEWANQLLKSQNPIEYFKVALYSLQSGLNDLSNETQYSATTIIASAFNMLGISISKSTIGILKNYAHLLQGIKSVADAHSAITEVIQGEVNKTGLSQGLIAESSTVKEISGVAYAIGQAYDTINSLIATSPNNYDPSGSGSDKYISDEYANAIAAIDTAISQLEGSMSKLDSTSEQYRHSLQKIIDLSKQKQSLAHLEAERLRALRTQVAKGTQEYDDYTKSIQSLSSAWWDFENSINDSAFGIIKSSLSGFDEVITALTNQVDILKANMSNMVEGSDEYNATLLKQINLEKQIRDSLQQQLNYINQEINSTNITIEQKKSLIVMQQKLNLELAQANSNYLSQLNSIADNIINVYKSIYEKKRDVAIQAIEDELEAEEVKHKKIIKNLEAELKQYQNIINAKLKLIDKESDERTYEQNLTKLQKERQEIINKINFLSMDDSIEAKAKLTEYEKQLTEKNLEIENLVYDHTTEARKSALEEQLEAYEEDIDKQKDAEEEKYNNIVSNLEKQKKAIQRYYDDLISDERKFTQLRNSIIKDGLSAVQSDFKSFINFLLSNLDVVGSSIGKNMIDQINTLGGQLQTISSGGTSSGETTKHTAFYPYKSQIDSIIAYKKQWDAANQAGDEAGKQAATTGASSIYSQLKTSGAIGSQIADILTSLNYTQALAWSKANVYHEGGIVGNKTSTSAKLLHNLFNKLKPNEDIIKVLQGEVIISPQGIKNAIPNLQKMVDALTPQIAFATNPPSPNHIEINIDKVIGTEQGARDLAHTLVNALKNKGIV